MIMALFSVSGAASLIYNSQNYVFWVDLFIMYLKPHCHKIGPGDSVCVCLGVAANSSLSFMQFRIPGQKGKYQILRFLLLTGPLIKILFEQNFRLSLQNITLPSEIQSILLCDVNKHSLFIIVGCFFSYSVCIRE